MGFPSSSSLPCPIRGSERASSEQSAECQAAPSRSVGSKGPRRCPPPHLFRDPGLPEAGDPAATAYSHLQPRGSEALLALSSVFLASWADGHPHFVEGNETKPRACQAWWELSCRPSRSANSAPTVHRLRERVQRPGALRGSAQPVTPGPGVGTRWAGMEGTSGLGPSPLSLLLLGAICPASHPPPPQEAAPAPASPVQRGPCGPTATDQPGSLSPPASLGSWGGTKHSIRRGGGLEDTGSLPSCDQTGE